MKAGTTSWLTTWRCGKGTGILPYYYFPRMGLEFYIKKKIGQVKTIVMEHINGILFHKVGSANKQHTNHSSWWINIIQAIRACPHAQTLPQTHTHTVSCFYSHTWPLKFRENVMLYVVKDSHVYIPVTGYSHTLI